MISEGSTTISILTKMYAKGVITQKEYRECLDEIKLCKPEKGIIDKTWNKYNPKEVTKCLKT